MRPNEHNIPEDRHPRRGSRFELFFYERVGTRYYLRFTRRGESGEALSGDARLPSAGQGDHARGVPGEFLL